MYVKLDEITKYSEINEIIRLPVFQVVRCCASGRLINIPSFFFSYSVAAFAASGRNSVGEKPGTRAREGAREEHGE